MRRRAGFSLIELLLVLTLAPIVFFAVYSNFSTGVRLWQRLKTPVVTEDLVIFNQKSRADLSRILRYQAIPFLGTSQELEMASAISADEDLGGDRAIGQVRYFYDDNANSLFREIRNYSQVFNDQPGLIQLLIKDVTDLEWSYFSYDKLSNGFVWTEEFRPDSPEVTPAAVRLSFHHAGSGRMYDQIYFLPNGGDLKS